MQPDMFDSDNCSQMRTRCQSDVPPWQAPQAHEKSDANFRPYQTCQASMTQEFASISISHHAS